MKLNFIWIPFVVAPNFCKTNCVPRKTNGKRRQLSLCLALDKLSTCWPIAFWIETIRMFRFWNPEWRVSCSHQCTPSGCGPMLRLVQGSSTAAAAYKEGSAYSRRDAAKRPAKWLMHQRSKHLRPTWIFPWKSRASVSSRGFQPRHLGPNSRCPSSTRLQTRKVNLKGLLYERSPNSQDAELLQLIFASNQNRSDHIETRKHRPD